MTDTFPPPDKTQPEVQEADAVELPEADESATVAHTALSLGLDLPEHRVSSDEIMLHEIGETRAQAAELLASFQRVAAEFDNFRKRTERGRADLVMRASQRVIESLLPALDSLDAAMDIDPVTEGEVTMLAGMKSTRSQILEALKDDGLEEIDAPGGPFDPARHEAISVIPGDGDQIVHQVVRKGYAMSGRVIRPALVVVGHDSAGDVE